MNLREGKNGNRECIFMLVIALCMSGLFVFESFEAYSKGNSTYISLPLSCIMMFLVFVLCLAAMNRANVGDFSSLITHTVGKNIGIVLCVYITSIMLICISQLLDRFLNLMYSYFFQEASYYAIGLYFLIVMLTFSWLGFETINRTAKVTGVVFLATQILLLANSMSSYESYKIYPVAGDGVKNMFAFALRSGVLFLPAFISALITTKGMQGVRNTAKNGAYALIITIIICAVTQILLAFAYLYNDLAGLYMPLYRMSMVTGQENFIVRLDKLSAFIWVAAALLAGSYYLYSASLLFCRSFKQKDIRPCASGFCVIVMMMCLLSHSGVYSSFSWMQFVGKNGTLMLGAPLIILAVISLVKSTVSLKNRQRNGGLTK